MEIKHFKNIITKSESETVEFKEIWRDEYLKTICAFANSSGGRLYIGIADNRDVVGLKKSSKLLEDLPNKINNLLGILPNIEIFSYNDKNIIVVAVKSSKAPISFRGRYYVRRGSVTIELQNQELTSFVLKKVGLSWDMITDSRIKESDFNQDTIEKFKELSVDRLPSIKRETSTKTILKKLNLVENNTYKRAAIVLFGTNPQQFYPQTTLKIGRFINDSEIISSNLLEGNLFQQAEKALDILNTKYLIRNIKFNGIHRRELLEYPYDALREAIIHPIKYN